MTAEEKLRRPQVKPIVLSPWLAVLAGLALYGFTLNHWVTLRSLPLVAQINGWDWHPLPLLWRPQAMRPLFLVVTWPVRLLPMAAQPLALNALAAFWAALALGLLARSVRLLPQDRTREQRQREQGEFALLSVRGAFLPALFAVLMLAGQINFWQDATAVSNDMLDLLVFAFVIWCLLEFRVSQNDKWLTAMAFVYGLGTTNNWALIGFAPLFLIAVIWIKGLAFFNWKFVARMAGCGLAGLLLYLLIPWMGSNEEAHGRFWPLLLLEWRAQSYGLRIIPRYLALMAAMPTILPLVFAGVRWPSFEGEISAVGNVLTRLMLRLLHVAFLLLALVTFFDFSYSPGVRMRELPVGFLTFYYLGALAIGYFSGYCLLVFGRKPSYGWERPSAVRNGFNFLMLGLVWLLAVAAPVWLYYKDFPRIQADNSPALAQYTDEMLQGLPPHGAIVLSDDAERLFLLDAACQRRGAANSNVLVETSSFTHREYIQYLAARYPELKKVMTAPEKLRRTLPPESLVYFLYQVGKQQPIYYLHPSFGYYFEAFYMRPHGLVYELKGYSSTNAQPPLPSAAEIADNQAFWKRLEDGPLGTLPALAKESASVQALAIDYAAALDFWGVELQRTDQLKEANACFAEALRLNQDNFMAKINLQYNEQLQKGDHRPIDSSDVLNKALTYYRGIVPVLKLNGPMDEPGLDLEIGQALAEGRNFRQATALFERRLQLLPGDPQARLAIAKTDVDAGYGGQALAVLHGLSNAFATNSWEVSRVEALAHVANKDYAAAEKILRHEVREHPKDVSRVSLLAEFYRVRGYAALQEKKEAGAAEDFKTALTNLDLTLEILKAPNAPETAADDVPEILLKKAELQMMLKRYDAALITLDDFLQLRPSNPTALLNHAVAEVQLKKYEEAKKDYNALRKALPGEPYVVDLGLADVAAAEKNSAEEIRCLKQYLKSAPDETPEYLYVKQRLQKLEGH